MRAGHGEEGTDDQHLEECRDGKLGLASLKVSRCARDVSETFGF